MKTTKLQQNKRYYGVRFLGGNPYCTTGNPNKQTGSLSYACSIVVFSTQDELDDWLSDEDLTAPVGIDGGERMSATKKECREFCLGESIAEFEETLQSAFASKREKMPSCLRPIFEEAENIKNKCEGYEPNYFCELSIYSNHINIGYTEHYQSKVS